jgi:hypothetical protein
MIRARAEEELAIGLGFVARALERELQRRDGRTKIVGHVVEVALEVGLTVHEPPGVRADARVRSIDARRQLAEVVVARRCSARRARRGTR